MSRICLVDKVFSVAAVIVVLGLLCPLGLFASSVDAMESNNSEEADFFVSPHGNDAWSGRLPSPNADGTDGPFATFTRAQQAVRELKGRLESPRPIRVLLRGGIYRINKPIVLQAEDSGSEQGPVVYAAFPGEKPIISGGMAITGWERVPESSLWRAKLPVDALYQGQVRQLFVNGVRATLARVPNSGEYFRSEGPGVPYTDPGAARKDPKTKLAIVFRKNDIQTWSDVADAIVVVFHSWTASRHRIRSIDLEKRLLTFTAPSGWPMGYWEKTQRYYVEGILQALDTPGEWYWDRAKGYLYYFPRDNEDPISAEFVVPVTEELMRLEGEPQSGKTVGWLKLEGLCFHHTAWAMPEAEPVDGQAAAFLRTAAVYLQGARHCQFVRCEIAHTGGYAFWFANGTKHCRLEQSHLFDLGGGGVRMGDTSLPDAPELQASHNEVFNCFIHDGGKVYHAGVGVLLARSSYNRVAHNEICDFLYTGVSVGWSWGYAPSTAHHNVIEFNHIHHLGWGELSDMGGVYTLGVSPGTVVRNNIIHDVLSYSYGGWGLYTDEGSTEIVLENNIVYRVKDGAFHQHYGRENIVRNNVLAQSATYGQVRRSREEDHISFFLERNIFYGKGVPMLAGVWSNGQFRLQSNCYWDLAGEPRFPGNLTLSQWQAKGFDAGSIVADPRFVDPEHFDFRLAPDSPALKLGFAPIDISQVGLVGSAEWVQLPKQVNRPRLILPGEN